MPGSFTESYIKQLLQEHLPHQASGPWYLSPEIPENKLRKAIESYGDFVFPVNVLALADSSVLGAAKTGIFITAEKLFSNTSEGTFSIELDEIAGATAAQAWASYRIGIATLEGQVLNISTSGFDSYKPRLTDFLNALGEINRGHFFEETD